MEVEYYKLKNEDVLNELKTTEKGLRDTEVQEKINKYGKNVINVEHERTFLKILLEQFKSYLVWLLIIVATVAYVAAIYFHKKEQLFDGIIITLIIVINALVGTFQDFKAEKTAKLLRSMLKTEALVLRNGIKKKVDAKELVPGDIIFLEEGDKVPADCRILESEELRVDESSLTGESKPVRKFIEVINETVPLADRKNCVYMNTYVVSGSATCVVVRTGKSTEVGKIAKSLELNEESPFVKEVDVASKKITYVALALIIIVLIILHLYGQGWLDIFMIGSALIIGSIPEGLPAVVTFTLSIGSLNLAKKKVLVKRKTLLETLGGVDVICTDKTGTLTQNKMVVKKAFLNFNNVIDAKDLPEEVFNHFVNSSLLPNEAKVTDKGLEGPSEDIGLIDFLKKDGVDFERTRNNYQFVHFEPFSSETKYVSANVKKGNEEFLYVKGAPEIILQRCDRIFINGKIEHLTEDYKRKVEEMMKEYSSEALRNIAFSFKKNNESKEVFLGFVGIYDAPKPGVDEAVKTFYTAGVEVKMITGDNIDTAMAIAKECGFRNVRGISWEKLKDLSDEELKKVVIEYNVFARMSPDFKLKIVSALQDNNKRVAITGDGVNDVPALKQAEVGVAMGMRGTDIAKEAGDLILLDDNFISIQEAIKEGRTIFSNVRKVINYLLTANLAEVFVVFLGSLLGVTPFTAIQILWVNFVTDFAPALALGTDPPHENIMTRRPTGKNEKLINKKIVLLTVFIGIKKVFMMFLVFYLTYHYSHHNLILAQTVSFTWLVFSYFVRIAVIRFDEEKNIFYNKYVNWAIAFPIILQLFILYTPISKFFHVLPLGVYEWSLLLGTIAISVGLGKLITDWVDAHVPPEDRDY